MPSWNPFKKEKQQQPPEEQYAPPPGPPPNYAQQQNPGYGYNYSTASASSSAGYAPPPGPPPSHNPNNPFVDNIKKQDPYIDYSNQPPSRPSHPPADPPPYVHDWTSVPDTALLPPPPPMNNDTSPTANASAESGESAFRWCNAHPLRPPHAHSPAQLSALAFGRVALAPPPPSFAGELRPHPAAPGRYSARTASRCGDACLVTALPLYAAAAHAPALTGRPKTAYFELRVNGVGGMPGTRSSGGWEEADAGVAVGFVAQPYPGWRLPGWQRGSLGVHGDDGRKYVNDTFGGVDFTTAFAPGETVGIGVTWSLPRNPPAYDGGGGGGGAAPRLDAEVFFTRDGKRKGGWDLREELDERAIGGTVGLDGDYDVCGAVGVFGGVDFEVFFNQADWLYRPEHV